MQEIMPVISETLITIGTAVLSLLAAMAVNAVHKLTVKIQLEAIKIANEDERSLVNNAVWRLSELVTTTVTSIEQTTGKALRESVKNGTADPEQMKTLAKDAYNTIVLGLAPEYREALTDTFGDFESYVTNLIEQKVWELKQGVAPLTTV